jgi:hypothetical protein
MYVAQLVARTLEALGDPQGLRYSPAVVLGYMQEVLRDFLRKCEVSLQATAQIDADTETTPLYSLYVLPDDFHVIERLRYNGQDLIPSSIAAAGDAYLNWEAETGSPLFYLRSQHWGMRRVRLLPYPEEAINLTLYYVRQPRSLLEYQEPDLDPAYHMALVYGAVWRILTDDAAFMDDQRKGAYAALYQGVLEDAMKTAPKGLTREIPDYSRQVF